MSTKGRWMRWLLRGGFWAVLIVGVLAIGDAGLSKFQNLDGWLHWFGEFGYPPRFALVVGATELVGAGLLLVPRLSAYSSLLLIGVMLGALEAVLTNETDLGWFDPVLNMALLSIILAVRWKSRWRPGGSRTGLPEPLEQRPVA